MTAASNVNKRSTKSDDVIRQTYDEYDVYANIQEGGSGLYLKVNKC